MTNKTSSKTVSHNHTHMLYNLQNSKHEKCIEKGYHIVFEVQLELSSVQTVMLSFKMAKCYNLLARYAISSG